MIRRLMLAALVLAGAVGAARQAPPPRMLAWSKALGVPCSHCHVEPDWADASKPAYDFALRMSRKTDGVSMGMLADLGGVTC